MKTANFETAPKRPIINASDSLQVEARVNVEETKENDSNTVNELLEEERKSIMETMEKITKVETGKRTNAKRRTEIELANLIKEETETFTLKEFAEKHELTQTETQTLTPLLNLFCNYNERKERKGKGRTARVFFVDKTSVKAIELLTRGIIRE